MRILLTGGGTGGHIFPLIAVASELKKISAEYNIPLDLRYMGPKGEYSDSIKGAGMRMHYILAGKIRRYFSLMNIIDIPKFFLGMFQTFMKMLFVMPDVIFSKGGPGAFPVVIAGWFYRIPVVIHESDSVPGLTNLLSSWFSKKVCISFEASSKYFNPYKRVLTGNPIRKDLFEGVSEQGIAKLELGFREDSPLIVVLGGSQGSQRINEFILSMLGDLMTEVQILHQTGIKNFEEVQKVAKAVLLNEVSVSAELQNRYQILPFLDPKKYKLALAAADIIIARAGSGTISEIAGAGKPSILIPLPEAANDHQRTNAYDYASDGAAAVIEESNLTSEIFISQIHLVLRSPQIAQAMSNSAKKKASYDAALLIAQEIIKISA